MESNSPTTDKDNTGDCGKTDCDASATGDAFQAIMSEALKKEVESLTLKAEGDGSPMEFSAINGDGCASDAEPLPAKTGMSDDNHDKEVDLSKIPEYMELIKKSIRLEDEQIPCHSKSVNGSYDSTTSGVGSNSSSSSPSESNGSGIKKRSNSSHRRNYRSANVHVDSENSNDNENSSGLRGSADDMDDSSNDEDSPLNKYMKSEKSGSRASEAPAADNNTEENGVRETVHDDSSRLSDASTPLAFAFSDSDNADANDDDEEAGDEVPPSFEGFFNVYHRDTSGSESSDFFVESDEESSSSSSDNYLEDIDERPPERSPHTSASEDRAHDDSSEGNSASQSNETKPQKKKAAKNLPKKKTELPRVLQKKKPAYDWNPAKQLFARELGLRGNKQPQSAELFRSKFYGSLFSAERLELMKKLDGHSGCVNCLNFSHSGSKLASGSDDLLIKIWNYGTGKCITSFKSGHKANVFQAKFVPLIGLDTMIVSCARDNQVRLTELNSSGEVCSSKKLIQHRGPAHKLSISPENPHVVLSCGEDGFVFSVDIREEKPERLTKVTSEKGHKVGLYSIHQNPLASNEFCVAGRDQYVRIYDARKLNKKSWTQRVADSEEESSDSAGASSDLLKKYCPHHLIESHAKANVTAAVYNYNGAEILASYNDENIYLFDSSHSDMADFIKVYEGHRNNATVKGVNFFGDRSQFVISGSDCGHIFIWDKETESIVNLLRGDEHGVVNCLEGHPTAPILATSGLDSDIKIWIPSNENKPKMGDLASTVRRNLKGREDDLKNQPQFDQNIMWALWNHLRHSERARSRRTRNAEAENDSDSSHESLWNDDEEDEDDGSPQPGMDCTIC